VEIVIEAGTAIPPVLYGVMHVSAVLELHVVVWHMVFPILTVGVEIKAPKLKPNRVTLAPRLETMFAPTD
jgi:hypothetical protein